MNKNWKPYREKYMDGREVDLSPRGPIPAGQAPDAVTPIQGWDARYSHPELSEKNVTWFVDSGFVDNYEEVA